MRSRWQIGRIALMHTALTKLRHYWSLILGLAILVVAASLAPWPKVALYLARLSPLALALLLVGSWIYYLGRIVRYWLMLRLLGRPLRFSKVAIACLVAQPVAVLPGGELYRGAMLKRYGNVSLIHGAPSVFAQSVTEGLGLLLVALAGVLVLHRYTLTVSVLGTVFVVILLFIRWQNDRSSHRWLNKLPWVNVSFSKLQSYLSKNRLLLTGSNFWRLLGASLISTLGGVGIVYVAAHSLGAVLSPLQAGIAYAVPAVLEIVSFLPGGLGVNEGSSVSILALFGLGVPTAVAVTLVVRLFTLGLGFVYGFLALGWAHIRHYHRYDVIEA